MLCNRIRQPKFTKEQIAECEKCKHSSGKKIWCCLFGVWVKQPEKKIIKYPSLPKMGMNFAKAAVRHVATGRKKRGDEEIIKLVLKCEICEFYVKDSKIGPRCMKCGCCMNVKKRWASAHCPIKKW